ncbi:uncharacterized protein BXZ73DRAFT_100208 [Epithele typhae]|uniref:uncharacterized protein n=1 Tax=Epithele typhae TaxID=378194 RepID=UPI00200807D3|nr:uncharacterized protein BXZ73DRAFT_100208 [Epithele typhae]KAH9936785.1 hypothetical protein BXZ73DRAFT_100208 [Epithele typhae]
MHSRTMLALTKPVQKEVEGSLLVNGLARVVRRVQRIGCLEAVVIVGGLMLSQDLTLNALAIWMASSLPPVFLNVTDVDLLPNAAYGFSAPNLDEPAQAVTPSLGTASIVIKGLIKASAMQSTSSNSRIQPHLFSNHANMNVAPAEPPVLPPEMLYQIAELCDSDSDVLNLMNTCRDLNANASRFLCKGREAHVHSYLDLRLLIAFLGAKGQARWRRLAYLVIDIRTKDSVDIHEYAQSLHDLFCALHSAPALRRLTVNEVEIYLSLQPGLATIMAGFTSIKILTLMHIGPETLWLLEEASWDVNIAFIRILPQYLSPQVPMTIFRSLSNMRGTLRELDLVGSRNGMFAAAGDIRFEAPEHLRLFFANPREYYTFAQQLPNVVRMFPNLVALEMYGSDSTHRLYHLYPDLDEDSEPEAEALDVRKLTHDNAAWQRTHGSWNELIHLVGSLASVYGLALQRPVHELRTTFAPHGDPLAETAMLVDALDALGPRVLDLRVHTFATVEHPGFASLFARERLPQLRHLKLHVSEDVLVGGDPQRALVSVLHALEGATKELTTLSSVHLFFQMAPEQARGEGEENVDPSESMAYVQAVTARMQGLLVGAAGPTLFMKVTVSREDGDCYEEDEVSHTFCGMKVDGVMCVDAVMEKPYDSDDGDSDGDDGKDNDGGED